MALEFRIHGIGEFDATHAIGPCVWPHFDLLTVLSGRVWVDLQHRDRVELTKGQSVLIYPQTHFVGASLARRSVAAVQHFAASDGGRTLGNDHAVGRLSGRQRGFEVYPAPAGAALIADVRRAIRLAHEPGAPHRLREALLTLILSELLPRDTTTTTAAGASDFDFGRLIEWVGANLHRKVSLDDMAGFVGLSASHFRAEFARQLGEPPGTFVRKMRQLEAARLLRETRLPTKRIALKLGYDDVAHFHRFFTAIARLTPGAYREKYQLKG